jgi:hypothetical protein
MSKYIIREIAYHYSDENLYPVGEGGIFKVLTDADLAMKTYRKEEIKRFRAADLGDIEPTAMCCDDKKGVKKILHTYFLEQFNKPLLVKEGDFEMVQMETYIPKKATDEQVWRIKEITGIQFLTLATFEEEPVFYKLIEGNESGNYNLFFNTQQDAIVHSMWHGERPLNFEGEWSDLSDTPTILQHLTNDSENVAYDINTKTLEITLQDFSEAEIMKIIAIITVMKPELIRLETLSFKDAKAIDHDIFEEM